MSAFYVTQRARKVRGQDNLGATGTISTINALDRFGAILGVRHDTPILACDIFGRSTVLPAGYEVWGLPDHYEPILPEGLEAPDQVAELFEPAPGEVLA